MKLNNKILCLTVICASMICAQFQSVIFTVNADENNGNMNSTCSFVPEVNEGSTENYEFVQYIADKENIELNSDNVFVSFYADGSVTVTEKLENGDFVIYSELSPDELALLNNKERSAYIPGIGEAIWFAVVTIKKVFDSGMKIISFTCAVAKMIGPGDPCAKIKKDILDSLSQEEKFEVAEYWYKDPSCPYPPNSLQCSSAPYAYKKTYLKKIA